MPEQGGVAATYSTPAVSIASPATVVSGRRRSSSPQRTTPAPRKRIRNFTADDRAAHRVFEKSRREAFKGRLVELAGLIPTLVETDTRRLSKHVVVDESISRHKLQHARCLVAARGVRALFEERDSLLDEVNRWRAESAGLGRPMTMRDPAVSPDAFALLFEAERDVIDDTRARGGDGLSLLQQQGRQQQQRSNSAPVAEDGESYGTGESPSGEDVLGGSASFSMPRPRQLLDPSLVAGAAAMDSRTMGFNPQRRVSMPATTATLPDKTFGHHDPMALSREGVDMRHAIFGGFDLTAASQQSQQPQPYHHHHPHPHPGHAPPPQHQQQHQGHPAGPGMGYMHQQPGAPAAVAATTPLGVDLRHHGGGVVSPVSKFDQNVTFDTAAAHSQHPAHPGQPAMTMSMEVAASQAPYMDPMSSMPPYMGNMW